MISPFSRRRRERELDEEIRSHLDMAIRERVARGESPDEAERAVRREFGDLSRVKEVTRSVWGGMWMDRLGQDLRFGVRSLVRSPRFAVVAVLTLALGVGLNAAVVSGVHALLLRPLSGVEAPDRLVQVYRTWPGIEHGASSIPHYRDLRYRGEEVFDGVAAWAFVTLSLSWQGRNDIVLGEMVSANLFEVLGVDAALGRTFLPEEDQGIHPVVVLSHSAWQERFGGDPDILGRVIRVNGRPFAVVGVGPEGFKGPLDLVSPTLWAPVAMHPWLEPASGDRSDMRNSNFLRVVARMKPGTGVEATREGARSILAGLEESYPDEYDGSEILLVPQSEAGIDPSLGSAQTGLSAVLLSVVGLLLLIACVNVANLFLVRAEDRRNEMRIRLSVGAGRARIIRQVFTESLLFSLVAGSIALAVAYIAVRVMNGVRPPFDVPVEADFQMSVPVMLFTLVTALGTGVLFGLAPALQASRSGTRGGVGTAAHTGARTRVSGGLVVVQTSVSVVLLFGAAVFLANLRSAANIDVGFRTDSLLTATMHPGLLGYDRSSAEAFYRELVERVEAQPGVVSAAWADAVPLGLSAQQSGVTVPGYHPGPDEPMRLDYAAVGPRYFETLGIPVRGRGFTAADDAAGPGAIVVNETMAARFWPRGEAIGRIVEARGRQRIVVGVAENGKYRSLGEEPRTFMYVPLAQDFRPSATLHVRAGLDPAALAAALRGTVQELDPDMPVSTRTMERHLGISLLPSRTAAGALALFGSLGLLLSAVGIYGVIACVVSRQTREIGIRMALGAHRPQVLAMVVTRGMRLTLLGLTAGLAVALGAAEGVRDLVYTDRPVEPGAFFAVPVILIAVALVATWIPARRAARIDPIRALKVE